MHPSVRDKTFFKVWQITDNISEAVKILWRQSYNGRLAISHMWPIKWHQLGLPLIFINLTQVPLESAHGEMASRKNKYIKIGLITCVHFTAVDGDLSFKTLVIKRIMFLAATSVGSKLSACVLATNILISLARGRHRRDRADHGQCCCFLIGFCDLKRLLWHWPANLT